MDLAPSTLINHSRKRQFEYSNSLTRPELLPVAVFYGKTQLENEQTPPIEDPAGHNCRCRRRRRGGPSLQRCTTGWQ